MIYSGNSARFMSATPSVLSSLAGIFKARYIFKKLCKQRRWCCSFLRCFTNKHGWCCSFSGRLSYSYTISRANVYRRGANTGPASQASCKGLGWGRRIKLNGTPHSPWNPSSFDAVSVQITFANLRDLIQFLLEIIFLF